MMRGEIPQDPGEPPREALQYSLLQRIPNFSLNTLEANQQVSDLRARGIQLQQHLGNARNVSQPQQHLGNARNVPQPQV
jgi:hypothetical protein